MLNPKAVYELVKYLDDGLVLELCNSRGHFLVGRDGMHLKVTTPKGGRVRDDHIAEVFNTLITKPKLFKAYTGPMSLETVCTKWKYFWRKDRKEFPLPCTLDECGNFADATDNSLNGLTMSLGDIKATDWIGSNSLEDF